MFPFCSCLCGVVLHGVTACSRRRFVNGSPVHSLPKTHGGAQIGYVSETTPAHVSALLSGGNRWCIMKREASPMKVIKIIMHLPPVVSSGNVSHVDLCATRNRHTSRGARSDKQRYMGELTGKRDRLCGVPVAALNTPHLAKFPDVQFAQVAIACR
jgi:hypothetical protein